MSRRWITSSRLQSSQSTLVAEIRNCDRVDNWINSCGCSWHDCFVDFHRVHGPSLPRILHVSSRSPEGEGGWSENIDATVTSNLPELNWCIYSIDEWVESEYKSERPYSSTNTGKHEKWNYSTGKVWFILFKACVDRVLRVFRECLRHQSDPRSKKPSV